jgi:tetratricopeptide (TPR) repeat protein
MPLFLRVFVFAFLAASLIARSRAMAQEPGAHHHGVGPLGRVTFPVSCTPEARRRFEHAMAGLHSFWFEEGTHAFGAVLEADQNCTMAHWGLALNAWGNPFAGGPSGAALKEGTRSAERASAKPAPSARERGFIAATAALYRDNAGTSNAVRLQAYADTMARLYRDYPGDTEVAIYYALAQLATAPRTDTTFAQQKRAIAILDPLFARHPDHPGLAHYVIHSADSPRLAALGLAAARRYADIAPAAPHAQHMPSHIFVRLGLWEETVATNWKAYNSGVAHAKATGPWTSTGEGLHALDYAVYGYLQRGQDSAARAAVAVAQAARISPATNVLIGHYNGTAMAARLPLEQGDWAAAAAFPAPDPAAMSVTAALSRFTRAIGAARTGRLQAARAEVAELNTIAMDLAAGRDTYWARIVGIKRDAAAAWIQFATGDTSGSLASARAVAETEDVTDKHPVTPAELLPARELLGDMLLASGQYAEARKAYQETLLREPGRARSLFGVARSAELAGDRAGATVAYREFLKLMSKADGSRPEIVVAKAYTQ